MHTKNLFEEIIKCSGQHIYKCPLAITYGLLQQVAKRCAEINDPMLNNLMCRLTMYTIADPTHEDYDEFKAHEIMETEKIIGKIKFQSIHSKDK